MQTRPHLDITLCAPRGFCAGVDRAIQIVELALEKYGAPVYVRHAIVHNKYVVEGLRQKGAVFVEDLEEIPDTDAPVVFSAHGVPKSVPAEARSREMFILDATCPLVSKVHIEANRHFNEGREIVLIGHAGHVEVIGTMGQLPEGSITLVETVADAERFTPRDPERLAFVTQTTLSVDETMDTVDRLRKRLPLLVDPPSDDICYATQNRQDAVRLLAADCDLVLVVGSVNSSNSNRLRELSEKQGVEAHLIDGARDIDPAWLEGRRRIGVTAGASAPELLVQGVVDRLRELGADGVGSLAGEPENVTFALPKALRAVLVD